MSEEISRFRGFSAWLVESTTCPCNTQNPFAAVRQYVIPVSRISPRLQRRPRAVRRRCSRRATLGKAADPDCKKISKAVVPLRAHEVENLRLVLEMQDGGGAA